MVATAPEDVVKPEASEVKVRRPSLIGAWVLIGAIALLAVTVGTPDPDISIETFNGRFR